MVMRRILFFFAFDPSPGFQTEMVPANIRRVRRKTGLLRKFLLQFFISIQVLNSRTSTQAKFIENQSKIGAKFITEINKVGLDGESASWLYLILKHSQDQKKDWTSKIFFM